MDFETLVFEKCAAEHLCIVTINRPRAMNAFNYRMCQEFQEVWRRVREDDGINAVVLLAADGAAFSTGIDVNEIRDPANPLVATDEFNALDPGDFLGPKANKCWKPVICAVHGMAAGGAFYWINESDIVICSDDASFFDPHCTYGMTSSLEPIGALSKIHLGEVLRMVLMGNDERIGAQTALRIGLVSEVTSAADLHARARAIGTIVAAKPSVSTQGSIKAIWQSLDMTRSAALSGGIHYCQLGNPRGMTEVDRERIMAIRNKPFAVR